MATVRDVKDQVVELKGLLQTMVATRALRDPLRDLHPDLTPPQCHVLGALSTAGQDGLPSTTLATRIVASAATMTGIIDRLERQGFVTRERDESDRRVVKIKLTETGWRAIKDIDDVVTERLTSMLTILDEADRETFVRLLTRIIEVLPEKTNP